MKLLLTLITRPAVRLVVGFVLSAVLLLVAVRFQWLAGADTRIYDLGMSLRMPSGEPDVVLVAIDRHSLDNCFEDPDYPISRHVSMHAGVIRKLKSAGARLIVLDILFDDMARVDSAEIAELSRAIDEAGNVILAASIESQRETGRSGTVVSGERLVMPIEELARPALGIGLVNMPVEPDGCIRRTYLSKTFQQRRWPSLAAEVCRCHRDTARVRSDTSAVTAAIDYSWYLAPLMQVSYATIHKADDPGISLKNRVVLIGVTESGSPDRHRTPLQEIAAGDQRLSGAKIQALAAQSLLAPERLEHLSPGSLLLMGAIITLILCTLLLGTRPSFAFLVSLILIILVITFSLVAMPAWSLIVPVAAIVTALIGTTFIMLGLNYAAVRFVSAEQQVTLKDIRTDLSAAHQLQVNLQPKEFPGHDRLDIFALQIPCKEVGGDYYDVVELPDKRIGVLVADVSGKGVTGSLIMSNMQGRFRKIAQETLSPGKVLTELNDLVAEITQSPGKFVTAIYAIIDPDKMALTYANAAHNYPIICSRAGEVRALEEAGPMLGPFPELTWDDHLTAIAPGESICMFTDGVTEAGGDEPSLQFGDKRVMECLRQSCFCSAEEISGKLLEACRSHVGDTPFDDDLTIAVVRVLDADDNVATD